MPRPRIYKDNASRQAAYRKRLKAGKVNRQGAADSGAAADGAVVRQALLDARKGA
jgi:hypothetical protein